MRVVSGIGNTLRSTALMTVMTITGALGAAHGMYYAGSAMTSVSNGVKTALTGLGPQNVMRDGLRVVGHGLEGGLGGAVVLGRKAIQRKLFLRG